jgi:prepilin peptidase CpaA
VSELSVASVRFAVCATVALVSCASAVVSDVREGRIPNRLTASTALAGLVVNLGFAVFGEAPWWRELLATLGGGALGLFAFLPLSIRGVLGFGDTKLMGALGLCLGISLTVQVVLCTVLAGGVIAFGMAVGAGVWRKALGNLRRAGLLARRIDEPGHGLHEMPYALAIACGTMWALAGSWAPGLAVL